jgi:CheY-like chemotaxis protein
MPCQKALDLNSDVVLLDVSMPNLNGLEAQRYAHLFPAYRRSSLS